MRVPAPAEIVHRVVDAPFQRVHDHIAFGLAQLLVEPVEKENQGRRTTHPQPLRGGDFLTGVGFLVPLLGGDRGGLPYLEAVPNPRGFGWKPDTDINLRHVM